MPVILDDPDLAPLSLADIAFPLVTLRIQQRGQRQDKHLCHLFRRRPQHRRRIDNADDRLDDETGRALHRIKPANDIDTAPRQGHLLVSLPQGGGDKAVIARIHLAARKADLSGMMRQMMRPFGHDDMPARLAQRQPDQHRRRASRRPVKPDRDRAEPVGVKRKHVTHALPSSAKNKPPLHTPRRPSGPAMLIPASS